jgi:hypothetical protein
MAKRKIKVGDSDVEKKLTETLNKNISKLKKNGTDVVREGVSLKEGYVSTDELERTLNERFNELTNGQDPNKKIGYASAYTNVKKDQPIVPEQYDEYFSEHVDEAYLSTEEDKQFEEKIAPYVKELTDKVEKIFTKLPEKQDNGELVILHDDGDFGPVKIEEKVLKCLDTVKNWHKYKNIDYYNQSNKNNYNKYQIGMDFGKNYEMVNHPTHYNQYDIEVIDMIIKIWGPEAAALWCDITAFKYRMRMGTKPDNSIEQDIKKEQWYLNKSKEIKDNLINKN